MKTYEDYLKIAGNVHLAYYIEAADILGIDYKILVHKLLAKFEEKGKNWYIINTATPITNTTSTTIAKRKNLTNMVLKDADIPVPTQVSLVSSLDAIKFFDRYKDIVVKPKQQLGGIGISIRPQSEKDVIEAYTLAYEKDRSNSPLKVLGEEFMEGDNYRLLVLGDKVIGAVRRKAAYVIGDGKNSIKDLIDLRNIQRKKKHLKPIKIDTPLERRLETLNMTLDSIPKINQEIRLRYICNLTAGGITQECMNEVDDYYRQIAVDAIKALGTEFGGVDIITPDITKKSKCGVNEINYNPGLRIHYKVDEGEIIKVAIPIMEYIRDKYLNSQR